MLEIITHKFYTYGICTIDKFNIPFFLRKIFPNRIKKRNYIET